jgi:cystathionine beta-lyase/cystathionine gamma-synthase
MIPTINMSISNGLHHYQRTDNFSVKPLEEKLLKMYGDNAKYLYLTSSGMEAIVSAIEFLIPKSGKIITGENIYFETENWLTFVQRYDVTTVDLDDLEELEKIISIYGDIDIILFDNPSINHKWFNVKKIVEIAHKYNIKVIVDNSVVSFYYYNPLNDGADILVESYSKFVSGHGDLMMGAIVFGYEMDNDTKYSLDGYLSHRGRVVNTISAYMLDTRLETLDIRMKAQTENCKYIVNKLKELGQNILYCGTGAVFLLLDYKEEDAKKLKYIRLDTNYGNTYSICTPIFDYSSNIFDVVDYLRFSIGLEDKDLLLNDIKQILKKE